MVFLVDLDIARDVHLVTNGIPLTEWLSVRPFGETVPAVDLAPRERIGHPPMRGVLMPSEERNPKNGEHTPCPQEPTAPTHPHDNPHSRYSQRRRTDHRNRIKPPEPGYPHCTPTDSMIGKGHVRPIHPEIHLAGTHRALPAYSDPAKSPPCLQCLPH